MSEMHEKLLAGVLAGQQQQAMQAGASAIGQREKFWTERDRDEKFEALREQLLCALHDIDGLRLTVQSLLRHQHSQNGELMTPLDGREYPFVRHHPPVSLSLAPISKEQANAK
jgi:hypothetical protein